MKADRLRELIGRPSKYMSYLITTSSNIDKRENNIRIMCRFFDILGNDSYMGSVYDLSFWIKERQSVATMACYMRAEKQRESSA